MIYVMLSRVCALIQIYILNSFDENKMYPSSTALKELERLENISINNNPTEWERQNSESLKISSLNCRSLLKHYEDIYSDKILLQGDLIALQETWLNENSCLDDLNLPTFKLHAVKAGSGKGIATYYKENIFIHIEDVKEMNFQLSKFSCKQYDIINLYRSNSSKFEEVNEMLSTMIDLKRPTLIIGDFNFCYMDSARNLTKDFLKHLDFKQIVERPTHIEGNLIDQAHLRDTHGNLKARAFLHSKYYSDHKSTAIILKTGKSYANFIHILICFR